MTASDESGRRRPWLLLHGAFAAAATLGLMLPAPARGLRVLALVMSYHVAVVLVARWTGDRTLWRAWTILAPMSLLMVLPDWFLSEVLGVLRFPDQGGPFIGTVPLAMAGMWTIALMPVVGAGLAAMDRGGLGPGAATAAGVGFAMFLLAELAAPVLGLWEPVGVVMTAGVAGYVLLPEVVLSVCAFLIVACAERAPRWATALLTVLLPFSYLGLLAASYQFLG